MESSRREFIQTSAALVAGAAVPSALARSLAQPQTISDPRPILRWLELSGAALPEGISVRVTSPELPGGNVMVVTADEQAIVIDAKFPYVGNAIFRDVEHFAGSTRTTGNTVMVNTHHHFDHTGGNAAFVGKARVFALRQTSARVEGQLQRTRDAQSSAVAQAQGVLEGVDTPTAVLESRNTQPAYLNAARDAQDAANALTTESIVPDNMLGEGKSSLSDLGTSITLTTGENAHTDNDVVVHFEDLNIIHTGDLVFHKHHPFFDTSAGVSLEGWINRIEGVIELADDETIVVPGHGVVTDMSGLIEQRDYLVGLRDAVRKLIEGGVSREEAVKWEFPFMQGYAFESLREIAIGVCYDQLS